MSLFRHKHKKIKYEHLPIENRKQDDGIVLGPGFSLDAVNLYINNFVSPNDFDSAGRKLNSGEQHGKSKSWDILTTKLHQQKQESSKSVENNLMGMEARKYATFQRLKRKLENIKNFYPDIYYSNRSVIELWARDLYQMNLDILDYDRESPAWLWI